MLHHMAVKQPQARIVGDKHKIGCLAGRHQIGVTKHMPRFITKFPLHDPEMMAMKMHGMFPARVVPHPQQGHLAECKISQVQPVSTDFAIESPEFGMFPRQLPEWHLLALKYG